MSKQQAEAAIRNANRAAKRGDLAEAERWSKTAERLGVTAEKLAAVAHDSSSTDDEEWLRTVFIARLERLREVWDEGVLWEAEREIYERQCAEARARGADLPPPLRMNPAPVERLDRIAAGEE